MWESWGGALLHFILTKQYLCFGAACLLYRGKGLCPPAWGAAADPLTPRVRSWARWHDASVPLPGLEPDHKPSVPLSPAAFPSCKTEQREGQGNAEALRRRSALIFCSKGALGTKTSPIRSGCTSGDAAGMSPTTLGAALVLACVISSEESTHLSGDSDTVVMAG